MHTNKPIHDIKAILIETREFLKNNKITQAEFSKHSGIHIVTIQRYVGQKVSPDKEPTNAILKRLRVAIDTWVPPVKVIPIITIAPPRVRLVYTGPILTQWRHAVH